MSTFVEKYLDFLLPPLGLMVGFGLHSMGYSFWKAGLPVFCILVLLVLFVKVVWRFVLVLELNSLGYTVKRSDKDWVVSKPGISAGPSSLTWAVDYANQYETEQRTREDERSRIAQTEQFKEQPSGMVST